MSFTIQINSEAFRQLRWAHGLHLNKDFAEAININAGTTSRIMQGLASPGGKFIGSVLDRFPVKFEEMFTIGGDSASEEAAADGDVTEEPAGASRRPAADAGIAA